MRPDDVLPVDDIAPGRWLVGELTSLGRVRDLVPASYAAHVRVPEGEEWLSPPEEPRAASLWLLRDVLARHTSTPDDCWLTFWEGFLLPRSWRAAPRLRLPHRDHLLFGAGLGDLAAVSEAFGRVGYAEPNLWWPEDRAWVAHWEVDSDAVYVGGSADLRDALLAADLGAEAVAVDDAITIEQ